MAGVYGLCKGDVFWLWDSAAPRRLPAELPNGCAPDWGLRNNCPDVAAVVSPTAASAAFLPLKTRADN
jgi:hypothetical protein